MTIKDLVLLYESSSASLDAQARTDQEQHGKLFTHIQSEVSIQLPPPSPARFIKRSEARLNASSSTRKEISRPTQHPLSTTYLTTSHDYGHESLLQINDSLQEPSSTVAIPVSRLKNLRSSLPDSTKTLTSDDRPPEQESLARLVYPANLASHMASPSEVKGLYSTLYTSPLHTPVPAQTIFARNACALSLPKLDEYLASLSPPDFPPVICDSSKTMFLPMEQLAKAKLSLDDLENNSTVASFWRDRNFIFGRFLSYLLAILVC